MYTVPPGSAYDVAAWQSFAAAEVGAAATLAGLLVVAVSVNITRIIELPWVVSRMAASLTLFTGVLMGGTALLVPGQSAHVVGGELAIVGFAMAALVWLNNGLRGTQPQYRNRILISAALAVVASLLVATAGVLCAAQTGGGLYWLVPGVLLAFAVGLLNGWVALVEILR